MNEDHVVVEEDRVLHLRLRGKFVQEQSVQDWPVDPDDYDLGHESDLEQDGCDSLKELLVLVLVSAGTDRQDHSDGSHVVAPLS